MYSAADRLPGSATRVRRGARRGVGRDGPGAARPGTTVPLLSTPPRHLYCSVCSGGARQGSEKGPTGRSPGQPQRARPRGCRQQGWGGGTRARATGSYVNGDSGGVARRGLRGRGPGALGGRSGRSWPSGVDGDDLSAATADQHHPVQLLSEDLQELHVLRAGQGNSQPVPSLSPASLSSVLILLCCFHPRLENPQSLPSTSLFPLT